MHAREGLDLPLAVAVTARTLVRQVSAKPLIITAIILAGASQPSVSAALRAFSSLNDGVQALLFDPNKLAPTYPASSVLKPPRFNAYYDIEDVKPVDGSTWKLELSGLIADKRPWTTRQIAALPQREEIIRHVCVEGWDYIGQWSGPTLRTFFERVGADLSAKYVAFKTADTYPSSIDMPSALHPKPCWPLATPGRRCPTPSAFRCGCAPPSSSATRTRSGSRRSR